MRVYCASLGDSTASYVVNATGVWARLHLDVNRLDPRCPQASLNTSSGSTIGGFTSLQRYPAQRMGNGLLPSEGLPSRGSLFTNLSLWTCRDGPDRLGHGPVGSVHDTDGRCASERRQHHRHCCCHPGCGFARWMAYRSESRSYLAA